MSKKNTAVPGRIAGFLGENSYIIVFVAIFIVYALTTNGLTWSGMMNVFRHSAVNWHHRIGHGTDLHHR